MDVQTMKAALLVELNQPLVIAEVELPDQLSFGQVLVKIHYSGICGSQINEIRGAKGEDKYLPHLLGHEGSGTVVAVGPGVKTVKPDDHVVLHWRPSDGLQADPPKYKWNGKPLNAGWITTFNEYGIVSENRLTPIPTMFDLRIAPLFGCAVTTGLGAVVNDAKLKIGESVVVFGVGGVGMKLFRGLAWFQRTPLLRSIFMTLSYKWLRSLARLIQ
jgi:S-(hydroxymethyl)glutathione dehydrogenase / alcohol dehydrogenase